MQNLCTDMDYVAHLQSSGATSRLQALLYYYYGHTYHGTPHACRRPYSTRRMAPLTMAILTMAILAHLPGRPSLTCDTCHIYMAGPRPVRGRQRYLVITPWQALALSEDDNVGRFATGCLANMRETILAGYNTRLGLG